MTYTIKECLVVSSKECDCPVAAIHPIPVLSRPKQAIVQIILVIQPQIPRFFALCLGHHTVLNRDYAGTKTVRVRKVGQKNQNCRGGCGIRRKQNQVQNLRCCFKHDFQLLSAVFCPGTGISVPAGSPIDWPILSSSLQVCAAISGLLQQTGPSPHPLLLDTPDAFCLLSTYYLHISHIVCLLVKYQLNIRYI